MYNKTNITLVKIKKIKPPPILSMCVVFILMLQSLTRPLPVKNNRITSHIYPFANIFHDHLINRIRPLSLLVRA